MARAEHAIECRALCDSTGGSSMRIALLLQREQLCPRCTLESLEFQKIPLSRTPASKIDSIYLRASQGTVATVETHWT